MKPEPNRAKEIGIKEKKITISRTLLQKTQLHLILPRALILEQTLIKTSQGILQSHQSKSSLTDSFILLVFDPEFGQICCFTKKWGNIYISSNIPPLCIEEKEKQILELLRLFHIMALQTLLFCNYLVVRKIAFKISPSLKDIILFLVTHFLLSSNLPVFLEWLGA